MLDRIRKAVIDRRICRLAKGKVNILNQKQSQNVSKSNLLRGLQSTSDRSVMVLISSISTKGRKLKYLSRITTQSICKFYSADHLQALQTLSNSNHQKKKKVSNPHSHFCIVWRFLDLYFCFFFHSF